MRGGLRELGATIKCTRMMLSVGTKRVKITTAHTCGTYKDLLIEKKKKRKEMFSRTPLEHRCIVYCESVVKNANETQARGTEIYPLATRGARKQVYAEAAGSREYKLHVVILFRIC